PMFHAIELDGEDSGISNESLTSHNTFLKRAHHQGYSMSQPERDSVLQQQQQQQQQQPTGAELYNHPMAMSAISEVPSPTSTKPPNFGQLQTHQSQPHSLPSHRQQANGEDGGGEVVDEEGNSADFPRNGRMTQSLTYGRGVSVQTRRQMLAHSLAMLGHETRAKQKDLDRREREVQVATNKATEQVEYMLKLTDKLHRYEDENSRLRQQVELFEAETSKLLDDLQEKDAELDEKEDELARCNAYCDELLEELGRSRQDIAQIRAKADELRVEKVVLSKNRADGQKSLSEWEEMKRANLKLQRQAAHAEKEAKRAQREALAMRESLEELQAEHQRLVDDFGDDSRSKKELLQIIRRLAEDKIVWESYCARLLNKAVTAAPQMLCLDRKPASAEAGTAAAAADPEAGVTSDSDEHSSDSRWESLFNRLLRSVMQNDPKLADCVIEADSAAAAAAAALTAENKKAKPELASH
uniref:BZIP domain-containing protein n=2 Tax=Macrostomum lignano TaxID=282301 RepID=A0A1I8G9Q2_9PLAT